jgi:hypothetical protein
MKKILNICLLALFTFAIINPTFATKDPANKISACLNYPNEILNGKMATVDITYKIDQEGNVEIISATSDNEAVKEYTANTIRKIKIKNYNNSNPDAVHTTKIRYVKN